MQGKLLGIDHGLARIGIAVSDPLGVSARALTIINRSTNQQDFERIAAIASAENVIALVVGIPYNDSQQDGHTQADTVQNWIDKLSAWIPLPIVLWDEQLSSHDARSIARRLKRKHTDPIDDLAAQVMLQSYLNAVADGLASLPTGLSH